MRATFVTGGTIIDPKPTDPNEIRGAVILALTWEIITNQVQMALL